MGDYNITIRGTGPHHNQDNDGDADKVAAETVAKLEASGHIVRTASITYGASEDLRTTQPVTD